MTIGKHIAFDTNVHSVLVLADRQLSSSKTKTIALSASRRPAAIRVPRTPKNKKSFALKC